MLVVCKESRTSYTWFFNPDTSEFVRLDSNGRAKGIITGSNLPNPMGIKEARSKAVAAGRLPQDSRVEADPVTVKLWDFWHAYANN